MKKVLLTLFDVAAIFTACDKDSTVAQDLSLSEDVEVSVGNLSSNINLDIDALSARLIRMADSKDPQLKNNESGRTITGPGAYLTVISGVSNNNFYEFVSSDDINMCDAPAGFDVVYLVQNSDYHIEVRIGAPSGSSSTLITTIPLDVRTLFTFSFTEALGVDLSNFSPTIVDGNGTPKFTVGSTDFNLACASDYYEVTSAPFPLRGYLATVTDAAGISTVCGGSSLNYAGTDEAAVRAAIDADIKPRN